MRIRGRYLILSWTAVFLAAAAIIVLRDLSGFALVNQLDKTNRRIVLLEGMRSDYQRDIAGLTSRAVLGPRVQALGLRFGSDSEIRSLRVPAIH
jgi:hypothetical protein